MSADYCTSDDVTRFMQIGTLSVSDEPLNTSQIDSIINMNEDEIDRRTGHAWRERASMSQSSSASAEYERHDMARGTYEIGEGLPIYLKHRKIRDLDSGEGDSLLVYNGTEWEEWLGTKTESRTGDYWCDYEIGILYLRTNVSYRSNSIKIKYRYGDSSVPGDIKKACIYMTLADLLIFEDNSGLKEESTRNLSYESRIGMLRDRADKIIADREELRSA